MANRLYDAAKRLYSVMTIIQHNDLYGETVHPSLGLFRFVSLLKWVEGSFMHISRCHEIFKFVRKTSLRKQPISWHHHWFPLETMSEERAQKFHTDDVSLPRSGSASKWSCRVANLLQPIRSVSQIWVVVRHQYGISACQVVHSAGKPIMASLNGYPKANLPSMQARSCETILRSMSLDAVSLLGVMESISSRNNTQGAWV